VSVGARRPRPRNRIRGLPVKVAVFVMALSIRDGLVSGPLGFGAALATSVIGTSAWIIGRTQP